jgi:hypothetical protein
VSLCEDDIPDQESVKEIPEDERLGIRRRQTAHVKRAK